MSGFKRSRLCLEHLPCKKMQKSEKCKYRKEVVNKILSYIFYRWENSRACSLSPTNTKKKNNQNKPKNANIYIVIFLFNTSSTDERIHAQQVVVDNGLYVLTIPTFMPFTKNAKKSKIKQSKTKNTKIYIIHIRALFAFTTF